MNYGEMTESVKDAENTLSLADIAAAKVAKLLIGRLRCVHHTHLTILKRELKNYNMQTGQWRD